MLYLKLKKLQIFIENPFGLDFRRYYNLYVGFFTLYFNQIGIIKKSYLKLTPSENWEIYIGQRNVFPHDCEILSCVSIHDGHGCSHNFSKDEGEQG